MHNFYNRIPGPLIRRLIMMLSMLATTLHLLVLTTFCMVMGALHNAFSIQNTYTKLDCDTCHKVCPIMHLVSWHLCKCSTAEFQTGSHWPSLPAGLPMGWAAAMSGLCLQRPCRHTKHTYISEDSTSCQWHLRYALCVLGTAHITVNRRTENTTPSGIT